MNQATKLSVSTPTGEQELRLDKKETQVSLAENLARHGIPLNTRCGLHGLCKGCVIHLSEGTLKEGEREIQAPAELRSCQCYVTAGSEVALEVPARSLLSYEPSVMSDFKVGVPFAHDPLFPIEEGGRQYGLAVDIGTTTVVVLLADLSSGEIVGRASDFNRQIHFGDDVLTRIQLCSDDPAMPGKLQEAVVERNLKPLVFKVCEEAGVPAERLCGMAVAGNTTMLHLLAGEDPTPMGVVPFTPRFLEHTRLGSDAIGLDLGIAPLDVHLLPGLAAYVGADLTAGIFATGMHYAEAPTLLADVGTNGEIILKYKDRLYGCATAAGPAFEGSGLSCGMRAVDGVVSGISLDGSSGSPVCEVIGGQDGRRPLGLCGSSYIDFMAEGRRTGLLNMSGRFDAGHLNGLPPEYILTSETGRAFSLNPKLREPLTVSERDIAHLLQAKGAIAAGIEVLLARVGLTPKDVDKLYLAGGFGFHINIPNAIACGLLPGFAPEQIEVTGNTALAGAYISLLDRNALNEMEAIRQSIEIIELNLDPEFEDRYINNLSLP